MWFASSGRSSAKRPQFAPWPRWVLTCGVVVGAPGLLAGAARERRVDRPAGGREAPARAADEAALLVGLVELERLDEVAELALPAHQRLLEQAGDVRERMHHQPLPDEARRVREAVRVLPALAEFSSSRGVPDRVGRDDDDARRLEVLGAVRCDPRRAGREALGVGLDPADARAGDEPRAQRDRLRPVGQVGRRLGALVAARLAGAPLDARPPAVVRRRVDRVELGPPVPAELRLRRAPPSARPTRSGAAASARPRCRADRPGRPAGPTRRTAGRSGRSTAAARSSRSASRRRSPSSERTRKSDGRARGQAPAKMIVEPPTALYMSGETGLSSSTIG